MNKKSCPISVGNAGEGYIVNCAGEKVPIADAGFTSRCAIGNTDDYLESLYRYISPDILALGDPSLISIIIPSHASSNSYDMSGIVVNEEH